MTKEAPLQAIVKQAARWQLWLGFSSKAGVHSKSKSAHLSLPIISTASAAEGATWAEAECMRFHVCVCMVGMEIRHWGCMRTWLRCAKSPLGTSIQRERQNKKTTQAEESSSQMQNETINANLHHATARFLMPRLRTACTDQLIRK